MYALMAGAMRQLEHGLEQGGGRHEEDAVAVQDEAVVDTPWRR
jgi:hypothetical protein